MTKKHIGIDALLVILGITIGILIGVVISKRGINVTSVRESEPVTYQQQVEAPVGTPETTVVNSPRHPAHLNHPDVYKQVDQATVLRAARQLNHEEPLNRSHRFDRTHVPDAGAAAQSGKTPELHKAGHNRRVELLAKSAHNYS